MVNPYDDGISLDTFADWLIGDERSIRKIDDYDEWLTRVSTAIRALPEKPRQHSLLPMPDAFAEPAKDVDDLR